MRRFTSTAVLYVWALTASGSQIPSCSISARVPVSPLIPHEELPSWVCLAWKRDEKCFNANWNVSYSRWASTYWNKNTIVLLFQLTLREVSTRIADAPQFWMSVRGMTSRAWATARYGHCSTPVSARERSVSRRDTSISTAPPPGNRCGSNRTLRQTCMASCRFRSTSWERSSVKKRQFT